MVTANSFANRFKHIPSMNTIEIDTHTHKNRQKQIQAAFYLIYQVHMVFSTSSKS